MRRRIILVAVVLGIAIVSGTWAQQQPTEPSHRGQGNAYIPSAVENLRLLRAQVVELRAAMELAEIQHDVDKAMLSEMMKEVAQAHWKEVSKPIQPTEPAAGRTAESQSPTAVRGHKQTDRFAMVEAEVERMKERYRERVVKLQGMKFTLTDLEERLTNGWTR